MASSTTGKIAEYGPCGGSLIDRTAPINSPGSPVSEVDSTGLAPVV